MSRAIRRGVSDESASSGPTGSGGSEALDRYAPGLDGLRAVSIALVLAYHADVGLVKGAFLGISLFFTLSGFLITSILLRAHAAHGRVDLRVFWSRRYRRLLPAAYLAIAGVVAFGATVATEQQLADLPGGVTAAVLQVANWHFVLTGQSYVELFVAPSPIQHFWSLAVEEQFYVLMPLALILLLRVTRSLWVVGAVFAAGALGSTFLMGSLFESGASIDRLYYGSDTRASELLVGCVLAVVLHASPSLVDGTRRRALGLVGLGAAVIAGWCWTTLTLVDPVMYRGGFLAFSLVSVGLIVSTLAGAGPVAWVLARRPFAAVGRITYGLYVFHWPIYVWLDTDRTGLDPWPLLALRLVTTFSVAIASYHLVEMPIRNRNRQANRDRGDVPVRSVRRRLGWAAAPLLAVVLVGGAFAGGQRDIRTDLAGLGTPVAAVPVTTTDPAEDVLQVLVVADAEGMPLAAEMAATSSDRMAVTVAEPFWCAAAKPAVGVPACVNWQIEWPALIERDDPDVVLFHVSNWEPAEIEALSGLTERSDQVDWTARTLESGLALLTANGATVHWNQSPVDLALAFERQQEPFSLAMYRMTTNRRGVRRIQNPTTDVSALVAELAPYERRAETGLPRVLVVGDSVARTLGYGLERWAGERSVATVWSGATEGCGIADEGGTLELGRAKAVSPPCRAVADGWRRQVDQFRPDVVIVLSTVFDGQDRRLDGWRSFLGPGDPAFDDYLVREYEAAYDIFSSRGAQVVWLTNPCAVDRAGWLSSLGGGSPLQPRRLRHINELVLERVVRSRPSLRWYDLDGVLCPDGALVEAFDGVGEIRPDGLHFSPEGSLWFARTHGADILDVGLTQATAVAVGASG